GRTRGMVVPLFASERRPHFGELWEARGGEAGREGHRAVPLLPSLGDFFSLLKHCFYSCHVLSTESGIFRGVILSSPFSFCEIVRADPNAHELFCSEDLLLLLFSRFSKLLLSLPHFDFTLISPVLLICFFNDSEALHPCIGVDGEG